MKSGLAVLALWLIPLPARADDVSFPVKPTASRDGEKTGIRFTVSGATDVEVAIVDSDGKEVRHLAAGVLGGKNPPPEPLRPGLAQDLTWDGLNDYGRPAEGGPFKVRVRAGSGVAFGRFIGAHPLTIGHITGLAVDAEGNAYVLSRASSAGYFQKIVKLDPDGNYAATLLPFPSHLPPDRIADWARHDGLPRPLNRNGLGPEFYIPRSYYGDTLLSLQGSDAKGLLLTDSHARQFYRIGFDGGTVDGKFVHAALWGQKKPANSGNGPVHVALSPDGKYLYVAGPYSATNATGYKADADFPPGRVYRAELGMGVLEPFVTLPTVGHFEAKANSWTSPHIAETVWYGPVPHGPVHDITVDAQGNVLVADPDNQRVAVFDPSGKETGSVKVPHPDLLAVHPKTGALYVVTKEIQKGARNFKKSLVKFDGWKSGKAVATLDLGTDPSGSPILALWGGPSGTTLWLSGVRGDVVRVHDRGAALEPAAGTLAEKMKSGRILEADRLAVDRETDTVYINDTGAETLRFNGRTGEGGERIQLEGKDSASDIAVGPDGYLYAQTGGYTRSYVPGGYSGPLGRYTRDLKPAPYPGTGTHLLSKYIYGAFGPQGYYRERGIGVGRDGKVCVLWMAGGWCNYAVTAWGPDGKPINGTRAAIPQDFYKKGVPADLKRAVISPLGTTSSAGLYAGAGVRVDSRGRIYVGIGVHPKDVKPPSGFEKDAAYEAILGSIVRFGSQGGSWGRTTGAKEMSHDKSEVWFEPGPVPAGALEANGGNYFVGADRMYGGYGPMSSKHADVKDPLGHSCACRSGRFDLDLYDRLYIPNPVLNSVRLCDSNDNTILEFGSYGNFDSQWVPEGSKTGKPIVATPAIPLGWPVGVGWSEKSVYVSDMYNRRVVRVDRTYKAEETCAIR